MIDPKAFDYIKMYMSKGYDKNDIYDRLVRDGWDAEEVRDALKAAEKQAKKGTKKIVWVLVILAILIIIFVSGIFLFIGLKRI